MKTRRSDEDMKNTTYKLFGKNHKATVTACVRSC